MERFPTWVYELINAVEKYEDVHPFPTKENGVTCLYRTLSKVPREEREFATRICSFLEELKANGDPDVR